MGDKGKGGGVVKLSFNFFKTWAEPGNPTVPYHD